MAFSIFCCLPKSEMWTTLIIILITEICLLITTVFTTLANSSDRKWNQILEGDSQFPTDSGFFSNKSLSLDGPAFSPEKSLMLRSTTTATVFLTFSFITLAFMEAHIILRCLLSCISKKQKENDKKNYPGNNRILPLKKKSEGKKTRLMILLIYTVLAITFLISTSFFAASTANNQANYVTLISTLNTRLQQDSTDHAPLKQDYSTLPLARLDDILLLMDVFGICVQSSIHHGLVKDDSDALPTPLLEQITMSDGMTYDPDKLKELGFCEAEGFKVVAVIFGILSSVLCLIMAGLTLAWLRDYIILSQKSRRFSTSLMKKEMAGLGDVYGGQDDDDQEENRELNGKNDEDALSTMVILPKSSPSSLNNSRASFWFE